MNWEKRKISLDDLTERFNAFLSETVPGAEVEYFGRDSIVSALGDTFEHISPPFPRLLSFWDRRRVKAHYLGTDQTERAFDWAHQEREIIVNVFARFLLEQGEQRYVLFSEAFYDDPSDEAEKAFLLSVDYDFSDFMEEESLTALMCDDTILSSEDFSRILIIFHHDCYELYDRAFAVAFKAFAVRQRVALQKRALGVSDRWVGSTFAPGDPWPEYLQPWHVSDTDGQDGHESR
jgi:hypothetical protein